jgi:hypothetical protein
VVLRKGIRSYIKKELSHIEFVEHDEHLNLIQRNIYSGKLITIYPRPRRLFDHKIDSFDKFGLRTKDFWSLFGFLVPLKFYVNNAQLLLVESNDPRLPFTAILTKCVYDETAFTGVFDGK